MRVGRGGRVGVLRYLVEDAFGYATTYSLLVNKIAFFLSVSAKEPIFVGPSVCITCESGKWRRALETADQAFVNLMVFMS
jgi:hypothetical protein